MKTVVISHAEFMSILADYEEDSITVVDTPDLKILHCIEDYTFAIFDMRKQTIKLLEQFQDHMFYEVGKPDEKTYILELTESELSLVKLAFRHFKITLSQMLVRHNEDSDHLNWLGQKLTAARHFVHRLTYLDKE